MDEYELKEKGKLALAEVKSNIKEAIIGYLETLAAMNQAIPTPQDDSVYLETVGINF